MQKREKNKYEEMWRCPQYRCHSPGLQVAKDFLQFFDQHMHEGESLIDFGCGTGKAGAFFYTQGLRVRMVDIASNCLDEDVAAGLCPDRLSFTSACLWDLPDTMEPADWIYCCDVLEHLPQKHVDSALSQMAKRTKKGGFLQIFLQKEPFGKLIDKRLHLTLQPQEWWISQISKYWEIKEFGPEVLGFRFSVFV
ncbi:MAG TPA: class I SAM-dependent methyltransferase [Rhabdochlamydiaceae bacterium]|jgi:2-polyprenyl-3-methyl-5-hydroxy-6-metoxy-1,4-benzoquinol methylase